MIWLLYNILFIVGFTLMLPRFLYRMVRRGGYARDFSQRFACYNPELRERLHEKRRLWIHAVSVGEVFVALKFMEEWRKRRPGISFVLTTTTSTGHAIAAKSLSSEDLLLYFPLDFPVIMRRAFDAIRPQALVLIELELWPNLVRRARQRGLPIALINGRVSDHSYTGYRKLRMFTRKVLPLIDVLCVQTEADRDRLVDLGARADRVHVIGSAKYDVATMDTHGEMQAREVLRSARVPDGAIILLGGSTWSGEEAILLDVYVRLRETFKDLFLVLVPRHAERSAEVLAEIARRNLSVNRRTAHDGVNGADVLLIDTTGELKNFYACADVIFVGKSLTQHGGQNLIEPAFYGKPIIVGPHMENFMGVVQDFLAADALLQVADGPALERAVAELLKDSARRRSIGERSARLVREKSGAIARTLDLVEIAFNAEDIQRLEKSPKKLPTPGNS